MNKDKIMETDPIFGETNNIDWLKARKLINDDLKNAIKKYNPRGQKSDFYPSYRKLKYLENELHSVDNNHLNEFFGGLSVIKDLVLSAIQCRFVDRE